MNTDIFNSGRIEETSSSILSSVKRVVSKYDPAAEVIFYGSRARGDFHEESDWNFLILTSFLETDEALKERIRKEVLYEIEFVTQQHVATVFHNKYVWRTDYAVTNFFRSIQEEGRVI